MKYDIEEINKLPILDIADKLGIEVKKQGSTLMACCFWHEDTKPSMAIYPKTNTCHCFVCDRTTNVLGLIEGKLQTNFHGAVEWLKDNGLTPEPLSEREGSEMSEVGYKTRQKERLLAKPKRIRINFETEESDPSVQKLIRNEEYCVFPSDSMDGKMTMDNSFVRCLVELFGGEVAAEAVRKYRLGSWPAHGRYPDVMFPSIDRYGRIRDIKIQAYDCDDRSTRFCHRLKQPCFWLGSVVYPEQEFNRNCLFGEHLLSVNSEQLTVNNEQLSVNSEQLTVNNDRPVVLVESPKNAVMGDCICPQMTWVAAGNKGMLKREVLSVLKGRQVIVFPDEDAFEEWEEKLNAMRDIATFHLIHTPGTEPKRDIADWIIARSDPRHHSTLRADLQVNKIKTAAVR